MERILFIKLGALGGVLRATPLIKGLKEKYPHSDLSVLTKEISQDLLETNPDIDNIYFWENGKDELRDIHFDWIINTEDDLETCKFIQGLKHKKLTGPYTFQDRIFYTENSSLFYDMGKISKFGLEKANELKKNNKRSYQNIYSEILGLRKNNYPIVLNLTKEQVKLSEDFRQRHAGLENLLVGINTGAGTNWPLKSISEDKTAQLIEKIQQERNLKPILLGGHNERERNTEIIKKLKTGVIATSTENTLKEYVSLINALDVIVTSDTLALHVAAGLGKRIVSFFGPTSAEEVEIYGRGVKIKPSSDCYGCYCKTRDKEKMCIDEISVDELLKNTLEQAKLVRK